MAKDKKAKKAEKKARVVQKTEKKVAQKEKRAKTKERDSDEEDVDLDAVLAEYAKQQEQFLKVTETVVQDPPSARASATLLASPANDNELFLFGGEYFNGALARFYNQLYIYNINRDEWRLVTSPNSPLPRSGHAWCRGGNAGGVYLFGGEFSSPKQGTFYHYNDFWRLDPGTREWTKLESRGKGQSPPARSGHRMTYYKQYIVLFGGFQDTSQQTKYLADLWIYDCVNFTWHNPPLPPTSLRPDARSSFSLLPHESGAVLYGGYSRIKSSITARSVKGSAGGARTIFKPCVHQDAWFLRISSPAAESSPPTVRWERRKRPVNAPNPSRAGATMAPHRGRGIQFGGVHDVEESEEGIDSEFFNTLLVWNVERNRYFSLALRRPKQVHSQGQGPGKGRRGRGKADEEELLKNLAALEGIDQHEREAPEEEEERPEKLVFWEMPHPRFNAQLTVQDDVLYVYGGTFEKGDREYTFDEMYAIDLGKLDGVKQIFKRELDDWQGSDDDDEDDDEDDDDEDEEEDSTPESVATDSKETTTVPEIDIPESDTEETISDTLPHPRPFESLRDFYARTSIQWQDVLLEELQNDADSQGKTVKEMRKDGFQRAEVKWWDCREEIQALEEVQEEAGIGEVVSLAQRGGQEAAPRRR